MEARLIEHNDDEIYLDKIGEIFFGVISFGSGEHETCVSMCGPIQPISVSD